MRPISIKLMGIIGLVVTLFIFTGCSESTDVLDEMVTRYHGVASSVDGDSSTDEIDVWQNPDCDGDPTTPDAEPFYSFNAQVVIDSDSTGAEFRVESYSVSLRPNHGSNNGSEVPSSQMPLLTGTTLNPISANTSSPLVTPGGSVTLNLLIWTQGDKEVYTTIVEALPGVTSVLATDFWYDIQVVLNCRTVEDSTFQITTPWTPVHFAGFDNC